MNIEKLTALGTQSGLSGADLRAQVEKERTEQHTERTAESEASRELAERQGEADQRQREADERWNELLLLELRLRGTPSNVRNESGVAVTGIPALMPTVNPQKLLRIFDERRNDLQAYLQRFERVATALECPQEMWATAISMCLSGEALIAIGRMTGEEALDYQTVKKALLQRFRCSA